MTPEEKRLKAQEQKERARIKQASPEAKLKAKLKRDTPEAKLKAKLKRDTPEAKLKQNTPEQKAKAKLKRDTPEAKERAKAYLLERQQQAEQIAFAEWEARSAASTNPLWRPFPNTPPPTLKSLREGQPWDVAEGCFPNGGK